MMSEVVLQVSQLNSLARSYLETALSVVHVEGEVSNLTFAASGHWYFTLKDEHAQVRCMMFRARNNLVVMRPEAGSHVRVRAAVSLYEARGDYQLIVEQLTLTGDGQLRRAFELLKIKLISEGACDPARKRNLPTWIATVGVITSPTGAALHDILTALRRRFPAIRVIIYPTLVQGHTAAQSLCDTLQRANERHECDVILLARGGGSLEDLWAFNEERVARAILASDLPVVTGIGHETDITIADLVADHRAATPTAAAEFVSPNVVDITAQLRSLTHALSNAIQRQLTRLSERVLFLQTRLWQQHPTRQWQQHQQTLDQLHERLQKSILRRIEQAQQRFTQLVGRLHDLSPLQTLARGYSITYHNEHVVIDASVVQQGDTLKTRLSNGVIFSTVNEIVRK